MQFFQENFSIQSHKREMVNITARLENYVYTYKIKQGLCNVFLAHTSASLIFCENADPTVLRDLEAFVARLVPDGDRLFLHDAEGPDDMPAHIRTILTQNSLMIPIAHQKLVLGCWQGVFLWEHRLNAHKRNVTVTIFGK